MSVGYVMVPIPPQDLVSSTARYAYAVCVSMDPFVLVSGDGEMAWRATVSPENFIAVCPAVGHPRRAAFKRYHNDLRAVGIPYTFWEKFLYFFRGL